MIRKQRKQSYSFFVLLCFNQLHLHLWRVSILILLFHPHLLSHCHFPTQTFHPHCFLLNYIALQLIFFNLFLAVLGLRFCASAFSSCGERGPLFIAVCGPLTIVASLVAEHRLQTHRLSSCGSRAQLLRSMWDLPRPGLEPVSPALASRFSTTVPPGKPTVNHFNVQINSGFSRSVLS